MVQTLKESTCQCRRRGFNPWVRKIPWRREWQPTSVFLPGESHGERSLTGYSPWGREGMDMTERLNNKKNYIRGFPGSSAIKNLPANVGTAGASSFIPESGRLSGIGNGNPLQLSCQDDPMDRENWQSMRLQRAGQY